MRIEYHFKYRQAEHRLKSIVLNNYYNYRDEQLAENSVHAVRAHLHIRPV